MTDHNCLVCGHLDGDHGNGYCTKASGGRCLCIKYVPKATPEMKMTDHATEAERFRNEYRRIRTPGQLPTTADVLALANYHATMAVADAVRGLAPKPVEPDDAQPTRCGRVRPNQLGGPYRSCHLDKGHGGAHHHLVQMSQDVTGSPQGDEQPEPGQVDGGEATEAAQGDTGRNDITATGRSKTTMAHLAEHDWQEFYGTTETMAELKTRAEKAETECDSWQQRTHEAENAQDQLADQRDEWRARAEKAEQERDAVLAEAGVVVAKLNRSIVSIGHDIEGHITWRGAVREFIDRYTPEG